MTKSACYYASRHLDLDGHTVSEMLRTGRKLDELPILAESCRRGELAPTKAREITRVASVETQGFWLEAAQRLNSREIEKMVAFTPKGGLPPVEGITQRSELSSVNVQVQPGAEVQMQAQAQGEAQTQVQPVATIQTQALEEVWVDGDVDSSSRSSRIASGHEPSAAGLGEDSPPWDSEIGSPSGAEAFFTPPDGAIKHNGKMIIELTAEEMAVISDALVKARKESGLKGRSALITYIARAFLDGASGGSSQSKPPYQIVIHHTPLSDISWVETPQGARIVPPSVFETASCDADILDLEDEPEKEQADSDDVAVSPEMESHAQSPADKVGAEESAAGIKPQNSYGYMTDDEVNAAFRFVKAAHARNRPENLRQDGHEHSADCECRKPKSRYRNGRLRRIISPALRRKVLNRDGRRCRVCGATNFLELHHLVPLASGGLNVLQNICVLCHGCHELVHMGKISVDEILKKQGLAPAGVPAPAPVALPKSRALPIRT